MLYRRLDDGSLNPVFIDLAMALCLADSVNMPATFYLMHTDLSSHSVLEGYLDVENDALKCLRRWVKDKASRPTRRYWPVLGCGTLHTTSTALMARVQVADAEELTLLIRYLRDEVLVEAAPASSAPFMGPLIRGLRGVLAALCKICEGRVAELTSMGPEAAGSAAASTATSAGVDEDEAALPWGAKGAVPPELPLHPEEGRCSAMRRRLEIERGRVFDGECGDVLMAVD